MDEKFKAGINEKDRGIKFAHVIDEATAAVEEVLAEEYGTPEGKARQAEAMELMKQFEVGVSGPHTGSVEMERERMLYTMEIFNQLVAMVGRVNEKVKPIQKKALKFFQQNEEDANSSSDARNHHSLAMQNLASVIRSKISYALLGGRDFRDMNRELSEAINEYNQTCEPKNRIQFGTETL